MEFFVFVPTDSQILFGSWFCTVDMIGLLHTDRFEFREEFGVRDDLYIDLPIHEGLRNNRILNRHQQLMTFLQIVYLVEQGIVIRVMVFKRHRARHFSSGHIALDDGISDGLNDIVHLRHLGANIVDIPSQQQFILVNGLDVHIVRSQIIQHILDNGLVLFIVQLQIAHLLDESIAVEGIGVKRSQCIVQRFVELRGDRIDFIFLAVAHIGRDALLQLIDNLLSLIFSRHDCSINTFLLWD